MTDSVSKLTSTIANSIDSSTATFTPSDVDTASFDAAMSADDAADAMAKLQEQLKMSQETDEKMSLAGSTRPLENLIQSSLRRLGFGFTGG